MHFLSGVSKKVYIFKNIYICINNEVKRFLIFLEALTSRKENRISELFEVLPCLKADNTWGLSSSTCLRIMYPEAR